MFLTTEYDSALEIKKSLPRFLVRELYLREGLTPSLDLTPSPFGEPLHVIYLGDNLRVVQEFLQILTKLKGEHEIVLVSPLGKFNLYKFKLNGTKGLKIFTEFEDYDNKVQLVMRLTGLPNRKAKAVVKELKGNLTLIERNTPIITLANMTGKDIIYAIREAESISYDDILMYICGSKNSCRDKFIKAVSIYRRGDRKLLTHLRKVLDSYLDNKLEGKPPEERFEYTVVKLSSFLYIEDAMIVRFTLDKVKNAEQLLKFFGGR